MTIELTIDLACEQVGPALLVDIRVLQPCLRGLGRSRAPRRRVALASRDRGNTMVQGATLPVARRATRDRHERCRKSDAERLETIAAASWARRVRLDGEGWRAPSEWRRDRPGASRRLNLCGGAIPVVRPRRGRRPPPR